MIFSYGLLQHIVYHSLCDVVSLCFLHILYTVYMLIPTSSFIPPPPLPIGNHKFYSISEKSIVLIKFKTQGELKCLAKR